MRIRWPTTQDLAVEPELAALALVEAALEIAVQALIARNPEMLFEGHVTDKPPRAMLAHLIVIRYRELSEAIDEYRALTPPEPDPVSQVDLPF
jgi:hypothetical protein